VLQGFDRTVHAACDNTFQLTSNRIGGFSQFHQLRAEFIEQACKPPRRSLKGGTHLRSAALCLDDQINRTVLQMHPLAIGKKRDLRKALHARRPGI